MLRRKRKQIEKVKNKKSSAKSTKGKEKEKIEGKRYEDEVEVEVEEIGKKKKNECRGLKNRGSRIKKDVMETTKCEGKGGFSKESSPSIKVNSRKNNNLKKNKKRNKKMKKKTRKDKKDEDDEFGLEFDIEAEVEVEVETETEVGGEEVEVENDDLEADEEEDAEAEADEIENEEEDEDNEDTRSGGGGVVVVVDSESRSTLPTISKAVISASTEGYDSVKEAVVRAISAKTSPLPPQQPTATTLSVTANTLEVPANKQARSASLDAPYLLKVPIADELADFYDESYPSSKANRSRSVDISLPTKPGEYYTVRQLISSSGAQGGISSESERNQARVTDLRSANESQK